MDGITILYTYPPNIAQMSITAAWAIITGVVAICAIIDMLKGEMSAENITLAIICVICTTISIFSVIDMDKQHNTMEVLIEDDVSMTDFLEKYDVISIRGEIYTIREKNPEKS